MLCEIIGIARSSYYKWLKRIPTKREYENQELKKEIVALYTEVNGIYGYRRITMNLNRRLFTRYNHKRIYRLMKTLGLESVIRKKRRKYKKSKPDHVAKNVLNREFKTDKLNSKWVTDVTEFKYDHNKKAYLSAILDLYDNSIVSYVIGHNNSNSLVYETLDIALESYPESEALLHSDRGYQYTSNGFKIKIDEANMSQSMSRVGRCIDNGPIECFWGILKSEMYYINKFNTFQEIKDAIDKYIYFYNNHRLQKRLNSQSPLEFRALAA